MSGKPKRLTPRQVDALRILAAHPGRQWSGSSFAYHFWPDKQWQGGGSRYDASARHGGRMLMRLVRAGLVEDDYSYPLGTFVYKLTEKGAAALKEVGHA